MPENRPPDPEAAGPAASGPGSPEPPGEGKAASVRKVRISFNGALITLLAVAVIAGLVVIGLASRDRTSPGSGAASLPRGPSGAAEAAAGHLPNCAPHPSACGFPDGSNTGVPAGTKLTVVTGNQKITTAGTVIDGEDIRGCVEVDAPDVTIRRSKISCTDFFVVYVPTKLNTGNGLVVQDVTISCRKTSGTGIGSFDFTAVRVDISGCENGYDIDTGVTVRDSYVHDPYTTAQNHADGAQFSAGGHITMTHNTIFMPGSTSAIISHADGDTDVLISGNLLSGGAFTLYCPRDSSAGYRVIDNRFSTIAGANGGQYGPWQYCDKVAQVSGNVWDATLKPITDYY
jgi:hypothetical protein